MLGGRGGGGSLGLAGGWGWDGAGGMSFLILFSGVGGVLGLETDLNLGFVTGTWFWAGLGLKLTV